MSWTFSLSFGESLVIKEFQKLTATITHNLGVTIDQLACYLAFATAADGTGATRPASGIWDNAVAGDADYGVAFVGSSADAIVFQTGLNGIAYMDAAGAFQGDTGSTYDYYRIVITRIK